MLRARSATYRNFAGLIAFLAIAVQVLVVGTHVHPLSRPDASGASPQSLAAAFHAPAGIGGHPSGAPIVPSDHDDCPLCVALGLAGNALAATPPEIVPPARLALVLATVTAERALLARHPSPFGARAPPVSIA